MKAVITLCLALAASATPWALWAQQAPEVRTGWSVDCDNGACAITRLVPAKDGPGAAISFTLRKDRPGATLAAIVPLGTGLERELHVMAGTVQWQLPFKTCIPDGCVATIDIDADTLTNFTTVPAMEISFWGVQADSASTVAVPFENFDAALAAGQDALAK